MFFFYNAEVLKKNLNILYILLTSIQIVNPEKNESDEFAVFE